jgi:hypothetical protein
MFKKFRRDRIGFAKGHPKFSVAYVGFITVFFVSYTFCGSSLMLMPVCRENLCAEKAAISHGMVP